ncbi:MAG: hypothetical protein MJ131_03900 [Lachnospiraceae bacterium]|nr:hypothetical protein [Lachnospiraceae bacterium]
MKKKVILWISAFLMLMLGCFAAGGLKAYAAEPSPVSIGSIDYEKLNMKVFKNGNGIIFYSTDNKNTWVELEGPVYTDGAGKDFIETDISWVSAASDVTVYFKGNKNTTVVPLTFPKTGTSFKVKFDKATGDFTFSGNDSSTEFLWRKSTDYTWYRVKFTESDPSYKKFMATVDQLRFKGCKLVFKLGQTLGKDESEPGERPSKEIVVTIPKMAAAPSVKINVKKLIVSTKDTMEYYDETKKEWVSCEKNMAIADMVPDVMFDKGGKSTVVKIRVAATSSKGYSQTALLSVPGQTKAPAVGTDIKYEILPDRKLALNFPKASAAAPVDYCIVKSGAESFDPVTAKWKTVKAAKIVKLSEKSAPDGCTVFFRFTGIALNVTKGIDLKLPSAYASFSVTRPAAEEPAKT